MKFVKIFFFSTILSLNSGNESASMNQRYRYLQFTSSCQTDSDWKKGGQEIGLWIEKWIKSISVTKGQVYTDFHWNKITISVGIKTCNFSTRVPRV